MADWGLGASSAVLAALAGLVSALLSSSPMSKASRKSALQRSLCHCIPLTI